MVDKSVKVVLRADVANYVRGMQEAARSTRELEMGSENIDEWGEKWSSAAENIGGKMLIAGGAIAAGLGLGVKAAVDWESAWTGVLKTVDGTPQQLSMVEDGLREMTSVLPASHEEIAAVAEAAGQLGIQTENVVGFTRTMIDLGETTNLSAEQAAMSLAQFVNIMGTSQSEAENLGSAIVGLGNNFATTESSILEMAMRLAGAGAQVGFTEGEVLGLATALSSVGIEAEAGGSAMSKVMIDIAASVEEGGDRLEQFAAVAGMTADQFATLWRKDSAAALTAFVQGLADAESQGSSTLGILADLEITEVRMRDALLRASGAAGTFSEAMDMGNAAYEENIALMEEAELRYGTTESKLGILRNRFTEAGISIGTHLLPALELVASGLGSVADMISGSDGPMLQLAAWGGVVAAGVLLAGGAFLTLIPKIAATNAALLTLGVNTTGAMTALRGLFSLKGGIALTAVWAALELGQAALDAVTASADDAVNALKDATSAADVMAAAMSRNTSIGEVFGWRDDAKEAAELMANLGERIDETNKAWYETSSQARDDIGTFDALGEALRDLGESDAPAAAEAFKQITEEANLTDDQIVSLLDRMPMYRDQLRDQAAGLGIVEGQLDTYEEKLALAEWAIGNASSSSEAFAEELEAQETAAAEAEAQISALEDAIREYDDQVSGLINAEMGFYEAVDQANDSLEKNGVNLDLTTEAGRENMSALRDLAETTNNWAADLAGSQAPLEEYAAVIADGREEFIELATAMTGSAEEAEALADKLFMLPEDLETEYRINTSTVADELTYILGLLQEMDRSKTNTVTVDALTAEARLQLESLGYAVVELTDGSYLISTELNDKKAREEMDGLVAWIESQDGSVDVEADTSGAEWSIDQLNGKTITVGAYIRQIGTLRAYGGFDDYASGGIRRNVPTGIYPGGANIVKFAEPETRWEAYISGKPGLEKQNIGYALEALDRLGYWREYADGGVLQQASYQASAPVVNVSSPDRGMSFSQNVTVTEAMSGAELVSLMRREAKRALADEMRSYR